MSDDPQTSGRFWWWLGGGVLLLVAGLLTAGSLLDAGRPKKRLTVYSTINNDFTATERSGRTVNLSELKGKVFTCAYVYTICPHGCAAVIGEMLKLQQRFGKRPDFHQVSIAVAPERDTPAFLTSYAQAINLTPSDPWWFLTGDRKSIWSFMDNELKLTPAKPIPPDERLNPLDFYSHDLRIVLIDRQGQVRGYYAVFHPEPEIAKLMCERLQHDTETLLNDPNH